MTPAQSMRRFQGKFGVGEKGSENGLVMALPGHRPFHRLLEVLEIVGNEIGQIVALRMVPTGVLQNGLVQVFVHGTGPSKIP